MKIPVLSEASRETLIIEMVENQAENVYKRFLELASENRNLYEVIVYLANGFPSKEESEMAVLSMTAILYLIEAELERVDIESWGVGAEDYDEGIP